MVPAKIVEKAGLALLAEFVQEEFVGVAQGFQGLVLVGEFPAGGLQFFPERLRPGFVLVDDLLLTDLPVRQFFQHLLGIGLLVGCFKLLHHIVTD